MPKPNPRRGKGKGKAKTPASTRKRTRGGTETEKGNKKKRRKTKALNQAPTQRLNVYVFGTNENGELGLGPSAAEEVIHPRLNPHLSADSVGVVQLAVGGMHCAALTHDNKILTWGVNDLGALGRNTAWDGGMVDLSDAEDDADADRNPKESTPSEVDMDNVPGGTVFVQLTAGDNCTFALTSEGTVYGWGTLRTTDGATKFQPDVDIQRTPALIPELEQVTKIEAGCNHVLALASDGRVYTWGFSDQDQLGRRVLQRRASPWAGLNPRKLWLRDIVDIGVGSDHSFAITKDESVYGWGLNSFGQAGIAQNAGKDAATVIIPTKIDGLEEVSQIIGGNKHSMALTTSGDCYVWGRLDSSATGMDLDNLPDEGVIYDKRDNPRILSKPTCLPDLKISFVAAGGDHSLAISQGDRKPYSWGFNGNHQTGHNVEDDVAMPTKIRSKSIQDKEFVWAGAGGQFSLLAEEVVVTVESNG